MAGLQTILNFCNGISIDRRKAVGIQVTRNEIPRVSQTPTKNPWKFELDMPSSLRYNQYRSLMEALDILDRTTPEVITFSNLSQLSWIFRYQGAYSTAQINSGVTVTSFVNSTLTLNVSGLPAGASTVLFEPNDLIQIGSLGEYPYPFTSTTQVLRGSSGSVVVTTSRPNILTGTLAGEGIIVGNNCQFNMFCPNMPTYKLIPGGAMYSGNTVTNNALLEWSDNFQLYEFVGSA
jgi:hypothetical protein